MKCVSFCHSRKFLPKIPQNFCKSFSQRKFLPLYPKFFFLSIYLLLTYGYLCIAMSIMPYSITNSILSKFYSTILWLYCDITYARINYAAFKLTSFESGVWWKIKVTNDVFSKFFSEKAIIHNNTTKVIPIQF